LDDAGRVEVWSDEGYTCGMVKVRRKSDLWIAWRADTELGKTVIGWITGKKKKGE